MSVEITKRTRACWMRVRRYLRELYDQPKVVLSLSIRIVKAEAIDALLYGCSTWTLRQEPHVKLRTVHHRVLLRIIGAQRKRPDHRMTSHNCAFEITRSEIIETVLRTTLLLWAGALIRIIIFPHISPISRTRGHRRRLPFPYHRYIQKTQTKEEKERKKITDEKTSPDLIGGEGKK